MAAAAFDEAEQSWSMSRKVRGLGWARVRLGGFAVAGNRQSPCVRCGGRLPRSRLCFQLRML